MTPRLDDALKGAEEVLKGGNKAILKCYKDAQRVVIKVWRGALIGDG